MDTTSQMLFVRRYCQAQLARLQAAIDFATLPDIQALATFVVAQRGRNLLLMSQPLPTYLDGFCVEVSLPYDEHTLAEADVIITSSDISQAEQDHIIAHEMAHLWLSHDRTHRHEGFARLLPTLEPSASHLATLPAQHTEYDLMAEQEAETFATLAEHALADTRRVANPTLPRWWRQFVRWLTL